MRLILATILVAVVIAPAYGEDKSTSSLRLLAKASFVRDECFGMELDLQRIGSVISAAGVDLSEMEQKDRILEAGAIIKFLKQDTKRNCELAWSMYGSSGIEIPNLITKQ